MTGTVLQRVLSVRMLAMLVTASAVAALALASAAAEAAAADESDGSVLILDTTVVGGEDSLEADKAEELGFDVDVVTAEEWAEKSTEDFASYRAIVLGDPSCSPDTGRLAPAEANVETWSAAVTGNVVVLGTDPTWHSTYGPGGAQGGDEVTEGGISFATADPGETGAYITMSCYYGGTAPETPVPVLDGLGGFTATSVPGCFDDIAVVAEHPDLTGYTEDNLGGWGCSVHNAFDSWPVDFEVLGLALDGDAYTAPGGEVGTPYILARGVSVISDIDLAPEHADVPVDDTHVLAASVEVDEEPLADVEVTFTVVDGPNEDTTGIAETGDGGEATFGYDSSEPGTDTVEAAFVDPDGVTQRSNRVTVTWMAPEGLHVEPEASTVRVGQDVDLTATALYPDGSDWDVSSLAEWTSEDPDTVSVDDEGVATGVAVGSAEIVAEYRAESATATVIVEDPPGEVRRIGGPHRYATAALLSQATFEPGVDVAYVATGMRFPDALTGGVSAALADAPVLLVAGGHMPQETSAELDRLGPGRIVVLGGSEAVPTSMEDELAGYTDGDVDRVGGADRFGTAAAVAQAEFPDGADTVYVGTGLDFPDVLAGVPPAADAPGPLLLTVTDWLPAATVDELERLDPERIVMLGGTAAISESVKSQLEEHGTVERLSGPDRFATSAAISASQFDDSDAIDTVFAATGAQFPDALTGGAVAGAVPAPVLLVNTDSIPDDVTDELERLDPEEVVVLGGTAAVSESVERELNALLGN